MFREFLFHFGFYQMIIIIIAYNGILIKLHTIKGKIKKNNVESKNKQNSEKML